MEINDGWRSFITAGESGGRQRAAHFCTAPVQRSSSPRLGQTLTSPAEITAIIMRNLACLSLLLGSVLLLLESGDAAVITGACERDLQCGGGMCCAVSLWIRGLRMCTPLGSEGDDCHPLSHKIPYSGKRMVHSCPCQPNLACTKLDDGKYQCLPYLKGKDYYY